MTRVVILGAQAPATLPGTVLTLNRRTAKRLGVRSLRLGDLALRLIQDAGLEVASAALSQRLLTNAVREHLNIPEPGLTARASLGAIRDLMRSGGELAALEASSPRVTQLVQLAETYRAALRASGVLDPVEVMAKACEFVQPQLLSLSGYPRLLPEEQRFLTAACADGSVVHLPWAEHPYFQDNLDTSRFFAAQGWVVQTDHSPLRPLARGFLGQGSGEGTLHVLNTEEDEVRTALGQIKALLLAGTPVEDIALVVPDDESWEGPVRAVAHEYGVPIRFSTSVTVAETRLGRWVLRALRVSDENFSMESVARLLAHPLDLALDGTDWQHIREQQPGDLTTWQSWGLNAEGLVWPQQAERQAWVKHLTSLMDRRGVTERAEHGQDLLALNFMRAELAVLSTPAHELIGRDQFFEELRDLLGLITVPSQLGSQGVELLTPPSLIGAEVAQAFFIGMAEGSFPAPLQDDPGLDFLERKRLKAAGFSIDTAASLSRRNAVIFWGALQAAGQATFSYARLGQTSSGLPSPYLAPLALPEVPPARYACSPEEARQAALAAESAYLDPQLPESRRKHRVEVRRLSEPTFDEYDGLGLPEIDPAERCFSASQLTALGRCGFKWWLEYGLRLSGDLNNRAMSLGRLRHEALRRAAERAAAEQERDVREVMLCGLEDDWLASEADLGWPQTPTWDRERSEHLAALRLTVKSPDFITEGAHLLGAELPFTGEWWGFPVRGVVDRADRLNDKVIIVDYKSGVAKPSGVQDQERKLKLDVQLPLYAQVAAGQLYPERKFGGAYYLSLKTGKVLDRLKLNPTECEALATRLKSMLQQGAFPPRPDTQRQACQQCSWSAVCRSGVRLERKEFL